jgi:hypothetical protein
MSDIRTGQLALALETFICSYLYRALTYEHIPNCIFSFFLMAPMRAAALELKSPLQYSSQKCPPILSLVRSLRVVDNPQVRLGPI